MDDDKQNLIDTIANVELPSLWRFALQLTRDTHDAEDLVQRTCVRAMEKTEHYDDSGKLKSWLFSIAHNLWRNELRSRAIRARGDIQAANPAGLDESELGRDLSTPDSRLEFQDVIKAVEALPEGQRLVVQLVCVNGFSYSETAAILDIAVGTVMSRLARARLVIGEQFLNDGTEEKLQNNPQTRQLSPAETVRR